MAESATFFVNDRRIIWLLIILGIIRGIVLIFAYPPAHAADSISYFWYAERLAGYDLPNLDRTVYPLYPVLIWLTTGTSVYVLIALQFAMSVALSPLYYLALKPYNPVLGLIFALVMLADFQVAILFNFTSTEPLYIFLTALTLYTFFRTAAIRCLRPWCAGDVLAGGLLVLLFLTRSVARYMLPPFIFILWLVDRNLRRSFALLGGFLGALVIWAGMSLLLLGAVEGMGTQEFFLWGSYVNHFSKAVSAANGPNSTIYLEARKSCPRNADLAISYCLEDHTGNWTDAIAVLRGTTFETIRADPQQYVNDVIRELAHLLATSSLMFAYAEAPTPGEAQCEGPMRTIQRDRMFGDRILHEFISESDNKLAEVVVIDNGFRAIMCPPLPHNPVFKSFVDYISRNSIIQTVAQRYHNDIGRFNAAAWREIIAIFIIMPLLTLALP